MHQNRTLQQQHDLFVYSASQESSIRPPLPLPPPLLLPLVLLLRSKLDGEDQTAFSHHSDQDHRAR